MSKLRLIAALCTLPVAAAAQTTIFNEAFASGQRATFTYFTSADWHSSSTSDTITYTDAASITQATGGSGRTLTGFFTPHGNAQSLAVGEALTFTFNITFNRDIALTANSNNFRFGVFDSTTGARPAGDSTGGTSASTVFDNYFGYAGMLNLGGGANSLSIRERTSVSNQAFLGATTPYTTLGSTGSPTSGSFVQNTLYTGVMTLTRTASSTMDLSFSITGGTLSGFSISRQDTSSIVSSFDTFAFHLNSSTADSYTLSQVKVDYSGISPIPEPSTYAVIFGAIALVGVAIRRRRAQH
ncbi:MAG: PEP-CTERM sorting domain-containing protein [Candidatus Didemnitutus sp.]|nr:PEP-CTERM sorting domain-containing protein [Candidatus Didemnitutus sp.]